ncbi:hypothetical protein BATDEDRAFT_18846 [Batrachochytrium dendrobatidis JAM81]|uniref:Thioredoxin-dependent peroxiredoxin n=2 Tax=Batrachochytrium dendrobatidis TaxID=109871 RepID=F4NWH5_BATDJ|nr:thioredoxin peroxidase AHP1 [Batrachochytrium dendrobatidis JAM81]EGF82831.1 hypothetical protein BATDEDRAFT_18846 [Batrachochytrium dendrobatidis JAM81]KAJ8328040.1 peroxiredoxin type-2 [Batrachochytrium dendrobatidis]KAK5667016.1 peroxiredoxin type-2 [Batrachochytrium dendrobatidis]OAJ39547.1 hypothetical protein BDEG_23386 [Batrachochytrium dendrobatidis JEL423]|eukprot:XP_006676571.1 hypothetical protein BATDEDRAFT_18846 [Batrachochytrium dendrobatidis JAM81]
MTLKVGDKLPDATFTTSGNPQEHGACALPKPQSTAAVFGNKLVVVFAVPGAFTPTCHLQHLPGFISKYEAFKAKGVDTVACLATNDVFVLDAWGKAEKAGDKILFLADGSGAFTKAIGMELDLVDKGLGVRCQRFAMVVRDGVVKHIAVGELDVSGAEAVLSHL